MVTTMTTPEYSAKEVPLVQTPNIDGIWTGSDGGTYYVIQVGNVIW